MHTLANFYVLKTEGGQYLKGAGGGDNGNLAQAVVFTDPVLAEALAALWTGYQTIPLSDCVVLG